VQEVVQQQQQQRHQQQRQQQEQVGRSHIGAPPAAGNGADAAAANSSRQDHANGCGRGSSKGSSASSTWACLACTFSGNKQVMLRCQMCGTPKGSSTAPAPGWLSGGAACVPLAAAAQGKAGTNSGHQAGKRGRGRTNSSGRSSSRANGKQLTLDQVVHPPR
jgi:hypothetical protein